MSLAQLAEGNGNHRVAAQFYERAAKCSTLAKAAARNRALAKAATLSKAKTKARSSNYGVCGLQVSCCCCCCSGKWWYRIMLTRNVQAVNTSTRG